MSSPKVIRDIKDRLKLSGGTLTGSLFINNGYAYATGNADESIFLSRRNFNDEKYSRYISISSKENIAIDSSITFVERNNDVWKTYKLYGEHNKPTAADIGALSLNGGTVTGNITVQVGTIPCLTLKAGTSKTELFKNANVDGSIIDGTHLRDFPNSNNGSTFDTLLLNGSKSLDQSLVLARTKDGNASWYKIYGEHNKPDPPSINAMYSHATGWDFTKSHSSHQVSFDQSQAVGGPVNEAWVNGLVSTHSNYLSSYIVNAHRSDNWYVGWSEHSGNTAVNPTWHKLLHDGNYNYFSPTLTGGGASGIWSISITGDARTLNGHHSNEFLRCKGSVSGSGPATKSDTLWNQIGIKEYFNALPDGLPDSGLYYYGACISFPGSNTRFDLYYNHHTSNHGDGLRYRTGWVNDKQDWAMIYDSKNITCGTGSASIYAEKGIYIKY